MAKKPRALSKLQYSQVPTTQQATSVVPAANAAPVTNDISPQPHIDTSSDPALQNKPITSNKKVSKFGRKSTSSPLNKLEANLESPSTIVNNTTAEQGSASAYPGYNCCSNQDQSDQAPLTTARKKSKPKKNKQKENNEAASGTFDISPTTPHSAPPYTNPPEIDYAQFEAELEREEMDKSIRAERSERLGAAMHRISIIALITGCVYLLFLIYGVLNTEYVYNDQGKLVPQILSVEQIRARDDFEKVQSEYLQARRIYEQVLELDYRIAAGVEDPLLIAPEYEEMLNSVNELAIQCQALSVSDRYTQLHAMIRSWVTNDIAIYCQNMSKAISQNNAEAATHALEVKKAVYNDFSIITANLAKLGDTVEGVDLGDITAWSPEKYINEAIGGIGGDL